MLGYCLILTVLVMNVSGRMFPQNFLKNPPGVNKNKGSTRIFGLGNENIAITEGKSVTITNKAYPSNTMFQYRIYDITAPGNSNIKITCKNTQLMCG